MTISTLVDSNIFIDVFEDGADRGWSVERLVELGSRAPLVVNAVIWSELAPKFLSERELNNEIAGLALEKQPLPFAAAFVAGRAHARYRRSGGKRERTLPDFLIGAHASVAGYRLLTRDASRYRGFFPDLEIIAPDIRR